MGNFHKLLKGLGSVAALAGLALVASATTASADITVTFLTHVVDPSLTFSTWTYDVSIDANTKVVPGDNFVIYDFAGFQNVLTNGTGNFTFAGASNIGPYPAGPPPVTGTTSQDNGSLPNLNFVYSGPAGGLIGLPGPAGLDLGVYTITSSFIGVTDGRYSGQSINVPTGNNKSNEGGTTVPLNTTPEAGSLALLLPGLVPVGIALRRRIKRA